MAKGKEEKSLVSLDFATVLVKRHGNQLLNPFEGQMALSERKGHLYKIKGKHAISSTGYVHLNKIASINLVTPQNVVVDGHSVPNPHIERHPLTRAVEAVAVRKVAIGFSPVGNIVAIDKTLFYNVYTYFIQSLQAKMKAKKYGSEELKFPGCAMYGTRRDRPKEEEGGEAKWVFYETARPLGIWANYKHEAIVACLEDHTQRQRFGDRIAQKIVERNCLKDHPAIGISQVSVGYAEEDKKKENAIANVKIYGWRHELEASDISVAAEKAEKGDTAITREQDIIDAEVEEETEAKNEVEVEAEEKEPEEKEAEPGKSPAEMEEPE